MARLVREFEGTWLDKKFLKAFKKLAAGDQERFRKSLGELIDTLKGCRHPISDPNLARFRPTPYHRPFAPESGFALAEFRLGSVWRVIVAFKQPGTLESEVTDLLLVAATVDHDHDRLQALIQTADRRMRNPPEP